MMLKDQPKAALKFFVTVLIVALAAPLADAGHRPDNLAAEWNFKVLLDGSEIGYHNFTLAQDGNQTRLTTQARFKVKFLFITAYRYEHENSEVWQNNCLAGINSSTNANGRKFRVSGTRLDSVLNISSELSSDSFEGCIKTFAYWNPEIFNESQLLNSQTGELLPVEVERAGAETLLVRGTEVSATRYQLEAKDVKVNVWYSEDNHWLALESTLKGGRKLRYELI